MTPSNLEKISRVLNQLLSQMAALQKTIEAELAQARYQGAAMTQADADHDIRVAKASTQAARQRKEAKDFSNADELNPKIWEATIASMRNTKPAFRTAKWNRQYAEAKRKLAIAYRHRSRQG